MSNKALGQTKSEWLVFYAHYWLLFLHFFCLFLNFLFWNWRFPVVIPSQNFCFRISLFLENIMPKVETIKMSLNFFDFNYPINNLKVHQQKCKWWFSKYYTNQVTQRQTGKHESVWEWMKHYTNTTISPYSSGSVLTQAHGEHVVFWLPPPFLPY